MLMIFLVLQDYNHIERGHMHNAVPKYDQPNQLCKWALLGRAYFERSPKSITKRKKKTSSLSSLLPKSLDPRADSSSSPIGHGDRRETSAPPGAPQVPTRGQRRRARRLHGEGGRRSRRRRQPHRQVDAGNPPPRRPTAFLRVCRIPGPLASLITCPAAPACSAPRFGGGVGGGSSLL